MRGNHPPQQRMQNTSQQHPWVNVMIQQQQPRQQRPTNVAVTPVSSSHNPKSSSVVSNISSSVSAPANNSVKAMQAKQRQEVLKHAMSFLNPQSKASSPSTADPPKTAAIEVTAVTAEKEITESEGSIVAKAEIPEEDTDKK